METGSKLFLILLFVGLTGNVFAMQKKSEQNTFVKQLTSEWEAVQDDLDKLSNFIERRGEDLKKYELTYIFDSCFQKALAKLNDRYWLVRVAAWHILEVLVEQGQYFAKIFKAALTKLNDVDKDICCNALFALRVLVKKGQYFAKIFKAALAKLNDENEFVREAVLFVLKALVEQGYVPAYNPGLKAALALLNDEYGRIREAAEKLKSLVEEKIEAQKYS